MKIAIFGGSFNPIHLDHIKMAQFAIEHLELDKLVFVPTFSQPFKQKDVLYTDPKHKIKMIELVLENKMSISDFEIKRKGISYSIETLKYFKNKYPDDEIILLIGADVVPRFHKWKEAEKISQLSSIKVFKRGNFKKHINLKKYKMELLDSPHGEASSTLFRNGHFDIIPKKVRKYIADNYLYIDELMENMLDPKRNKHSRAVARKAVEYATVLGVNKKDAFVAGKLHDITKSWPWEIHANLLELYGLDINDYKEYEVHSLTSSLWAEHQYGIKNKLLTEAILKHTSLALELSDMDKVLYAADKLADGRKWEGINFIRKTILEDFNKGFSMLINEIYCKINLNNNISEESKVIYERWSKW